MWLTDSMLVTNFLSKGSKVGFIQQILVEIKAFEYIHLRLLAKHERGHGLSSTNAEFAEAKGAVAAAME